MTFVLGRYRLERGDEARLVVERIGREPRFGIPRPKAKCVRPVVERDDAQPLPAERANRAEAVYPADFRDHGRALPRHPGESS